MTRPATPNHRWDIGAVEIERIEENIVPLPTKVLVPDATEQQIEANRDWLAPYFDPSGDDGPVLRLSLHSFLVRSEGKIIVVDTCVGPDPERPLKGDPGFADRLEAAIDGGLAAVDVVVCTHLHFDHVGWNTRTIDGSVVPTFPTARYLITAGEMAELERDDHMAVREPSIQPLIDADVVDVIDVGGQGSPGYQITDEVGLLATPGHTPGHVSVLIRSQGDVGLITGDAFHSPLQFAYPELAAWRFDTDAARSTETRKMLLTRFVNSDALILGTHFAPPTAGRLRRGNGPDSGDPEGAGPNGGGRVWFATDRGAG